MTTTTERTRARHTRRRAAVAGALGLIAWIAVARTAGAQGPRPTIIVGGSWSGYGVNQALGRAFSEATGIRMGVRGWDNARGFEYLAAGRMDVLVYSPQVGGTAQEAIEAAFGNGKPHPVGLALGRFAVCVAVHPSNPIAGLSVAQLREMLAGRIDDWEALGRRPGRIVLVGEGAGSKSREMLAKLVLLGTSFSPALIRRKSDASVMAMVSKDRNALGCFLSRGESMEGVKVLPLRAKPDGPLVPLGDLSVLDGTYPLVEELWLYLPPGAPPWSEAYCAFAVSPKGAEIARKWSLYPECERQALLADRRVAQMKAGRGTRVSVIGVGAGEAPLQDLAVEYTRARQVVQVAYVAVGSDLACVGKFVAGGPGNRELMLLADKPGVRALRIHATRWNALGPEGTGPAEHVIAGRVAAIVVHPANPVESLTLGQVQGIFGGSIDDWGVIGARRGARDGGSTAGAEVRRTGERRARGGRSPHPDPRPTGEGARGGIRRFGVRANDPAAAVFHTECLPADRLRRVAIQRDTAEVVAAVSMDPNAIGFVDLTAMPTSGQNVKVLAIQLGSGVRARVVRPTPENIRNALYPFSQRLHLYLHPKASEAARDFAAFVATCGASVVTAAASARSPVPPSVDTVKVVMDTYRQHGLIPLADAAIRRALQEAVNAATAHRGNKRHGEQTNESLKPIR